MEQRVRHIEEHSPPDRGGRGRWRLAGVLAAGVLMALGFWGWRSGRTGVEAPLIEVPEAEAVGRSFFDALASGDVGSAVDLLAADRSAIVLPALSAPLGPDRDPAPALDFVSRVVDMALGRCDVTSAPGPNSDTALVRCDVAVSSGYRSGLGLEGSEGRVTIAVRATGIRSIFSSVDDRLAGFEHYCLWARERHASDAAVAFDERCRPVETGQTALVHERLADGYDAVRWRQSFGPRPALDLVEAFARIHNAGGAPIGLFEDTYRVASFPGVPVEAPRWPFPDLEEYLTWSSIVYDIVLGPCTAERRSGPRLSAVSCPEAMLAGALPDALGLGAVLAPMEFYVSEGRISGVSGRTPAVLVEAFQTFCGRTRPEGTAIGGDACTPRYEAASADALIAAAGT